MSEITCDLCFHHCHIKEGMTGMCRARRNKGGRNVCDNYGRLTAMALDPVEKKPLKHFYPGSYILSVGSYGCNLSCPFCQNSMISMVDENHCSWRYSSAEELCQTALGRKDNLGIAFTYNEPLISYEYIIDCAKILHGSDKKIVVVSNGTIARNVLENLVPYVDAVNIDYKGDDAYYRELGGSGQMVRDTIAYMVKYCHVEVTTLLIPGKNDSMDFIEKEAQWLADVNPDVVLHLSRYFPSFHYHLPPTDINVMKQAQQTAQKYLRYVYLGNV